MNNEKIKLGIIIGGKSVEHEISVISGLQTYFSVDHNKYDTTIFYLDKNNHIYVSKELNSIETYKSNYINKEKEVFIKNINNQNILPVFKQTQKELSNRYLYTSITWLWNRRWNSCRISRYISSNLYL